MAIWILLAVVFGILALKWKIATLNLIYYMQKNQYKLPTDEDMKECTEFVAKNIIKDLTGH